MKKLFYKNIELFYETFGNFENQAIVLLHGYLESMETWGDFARELQDDFFVITPDLPGHGLSGIYSGNHNMDELADAVRIIMDGLHIEQIHLIGHSMGGYITMAFRELFPNRLLSFTLFHSHCFADPEEKKINREREIELVKSGKKELIVSTNIPRIFADNNLEKFSAEVARAKEIAMKTPEEGIIAMLNGMKNRPDRCNLLIQGGIPGLLIAGFYDNHIPKSMVDKMISFSRNMKRVDLQNSGHMGLIEEKDKSIQVIRDFLIQTKAVQ